MKVTAKDYLSQTSLLRLLAVLALVIAPHLTRLPPWLVAVVVCVGVWRGVAALRNWPLPPWWLNWLMAIAAITSVAATFEGRISGQHAGTALLVIMVALKLTEMRSRRDVLVVVSLCYFTMLTHFLFSQEIWTITYLLGCAVAVTAILIEVNHAGEPLPLRNLLRQGAVMVGHALPLMVVLFVLFPRVPGPLWGLPSDAGAGRTGMANSMEPGDISRLIENDEVAFRVRFLTEPPPMNERYWRGPVFSYFNGRRWSAPFNGDDYFSFYRRGSKLSAYEPAQGDLLGGPVQYEVTLEPHRQNWLFGLDLPSAEALPEGAALTGYFQLLSVELVKDRKVYTATSFTRYRLQPRLPEGEARINLRLPAGNPRTVALAQKFRDAGGDEFDIANRALKMFREEKFFYTLQPPTLGADMVDEFLFETRRGFCEHYAGAFTVLMRAAGIPARVVAGYQGGEQNALGDYYVVRQSDAHAWTEIWAKDRGWVRVDPTAAVAPSRIEVGVSAALASSEVPGYLRRSGAGGLWYWRLQASFAWDWVSVRWDRWVLAYSPDKQMALLSHVGLGDWQNMVLALTVLLTLFMSIVGLIVLRQARPAVPPDLALRLWRRAAKRLADAGLPQHPAEGPRDYAERVARERPDLAPVIERLLKSYLSARYLLIEPKGAEVELAAALKALKA